MKQGPRISLPREAINNYLNGHNLMLKKQYAQGLPLLELTGRAGHPEALREIGDAYMAGNGVTVNVTNAYQFYQAAAFRGDAAALRTIATNLRGIITMFPWKMYAQYSKMSRCDNVYDNAVRQHISEQNDPNNKSVAGPSSPSARDAMLSMATARKNGITTMDFHGHTSRTLDPRVRTYMSNAAVWGDLDGLCLYTEMFAKGSPNIALQYQRVAAYMGHSFSMYRVAQHYEMIEPDSARKCYLTSARWGYGPAADWCLRHGVSLNEEL